MGWDGMRWVLSLSDVEGGDLKLEMEVGTPFWKAQPRARGHAYGLRSLIEYAAPCADVFAMR